MIHGVIRRRILVNFRVAPDAIRAQLPGRFRPKLHRGYAIAGICLIRLEAIRPRGLPGLLGASSENAAHRIAVEWTADGGETREGVFIPRRDTGSFLNHLAGGRIFPGEHNRARFDVREEADRLTLAMVSRDGRVAVRVAGTYGGSLPAQSCFASVSEASRFFEPGSLGYSVTGDPRRLDGIELQTHGWQVDPLQVEDVWSSYLGDQKLFPAGAATFDCALAMRNLRHEWHSSGDLYT